QAASSKKAAAAGNIVFFMISSYCWMTNLAKIRLINNRLRGEGDRISKFFYLCPYHGYISTIRPYNRALPAAIRKKNGRLRHGVAHYASCFHHRPVVHQGPAHPYA